MFEAKLAQPRKKKRSRYNRTVEDGTFKSPHEPVLQQPFPVPISSLTGIKADNSVWRWYQGNLKSRRKPDLQIHVLGKQNLMLGTDEICDKTKLYYYVEIKPDNEAHSILSQMGFFGETEENLVTYRNASKAESTENDTYVAVEDFEPEIVLSKEDSVDNKTNIENNSFENRPVTSDRFDAPGYLRLELYEAFFLSYGLGCLLVNDCDREYEQMSIDDMWNKFCNVDSDFPHQYAVYHHFRSKGWVVKNGCKFGADFLLYKDGPPFYHASYSVWIRRHFKNPGEGYNGESTQTLDWTSLSGLNRVTESASKELLLIDMFGSKDLIHKSTTVTEYFAAINLQEVLVRRWVASSEKQDSTGFVD